MNKILNVKTSFKIKELFSLNLIAKFLGLQNSNICLLTMVSFSGYVSIAIV